jgi:hypothetical protein
VLKRLSSTDEPRAELVARLARELECYTSPRLQLLFILIAAGGAGFLASVLLLWSPAQTFELMAPRYAVAALCGYLTFILLIRVWIALHRPPADDVHLDFDVDPLEVLDAIVPRPSDPSSSDSAPLFSGGRSGGAGGSRQWLGQGPSDGASGRSWGLDFDLDEGIWLLVAAAAALAGLTAIGYVIYMAPVLLAEVALDAAIISVLYRRLRHDEQAYWLTTVLRHTWAPALVLVVFAFFAGFALQQAAPEARSIGAVVQSLSGTTPR